MNFKKFLEILETCKNDIGKDKTKQDIRIKWMLTGPRSTFIRGKTQYGNYCPITAVAYKMHQISYDSHSSESSFYAGESIELVKDDIHTVVLAADYNYGLTKKCFLFREKMMIVLGLQEINMVEVVK